MRGEPDLELDQRRRPYPGGHRLHGHVLWRGQHSLARQPRPHHHRQRGCRRHQADHQRILRLHEPGDGELCRKQPAADAGRLCVQELHQSEIHHPSRGTDRHQRQCLQVLPQSPERLSAGHHVRHRQSGLYRPLRHYLQRGQGQLCQALGGVPRLCLHGA